MSFLTSAAAMVVGGIVGGMATSSVREEAETHSEVIKSNALCCIACTAVALVVDGVLSHYFDTDTNSNSTSK